MRSVRDGGLAKATTVGLRWLVLAAVILLYVLPVGMLVFGAFRDAPPGQPGSWSLDGIVQAFSSATLATGFGNSVFLGTMMGIIGTAIAAAMAAIATRSDAKIARWVTPLMAIVLATPPLFFALSWDVLGTDGLGIVNEGLDAVGLPSLVISGAWGTAAVGGVKVASLIYFILLGPFSAMDHRLEEASRVFGAGSVRTFFSVTLPTLAPGLFGGFIIAFIIGLTAFDIPLIIGLPEGFNVFATLIYSYLNETSPPNYASASTLGLVLVVAVMVVVGIRWWVLDRRSFVTLGGKSGGQRTEGTAFARRLATTAVVVFALIGFVLPVAQMVLGSLQRVFGSNSSLSLANYTRILRDPQLGTMLGNTFLLAVAGGLIAVAVAFLLASIGRYGTAPMRRTLDMATWLPWAANGILLGLGLLWMFLTIPFLRGLFGTVWILLIGLVVAATPLASRAVEAAMVQISRDLEEAGRISGATATRVSLGIVLRLMLPALLAGWFICAINIIGNLEVPILLSGPSNPTLAVTVYRLYGNGQGTQAAALFCLVLGLGLAIAAVAWLLSRLGRRLLAARGIADDPALSTADTATTRK